MEKKVLELFDELNENILIYNTYYNKSLIQEAFLFAYKAHKWTYRKSWDPYIVHSLQTALNLTRIEADEISIIWALLHDIFENPAYNIKIVEEKLWKDIAWIVAWVNKISDYYYTPSMSKKEVEELKKWILSAWDDIRIFLIKIADRLHNMETLDFLPKNKRYRIAKETEEIYIPMVNFLWIWEYLADFHDLCFKHTNEKEYKNLFKIFWKKQKFYEDTIIEINNILEKELKKLKIDFKISSRIKSLYSIHKKMKSKNLDLSEISDVLALRVTTPKESDCYLILWVIHNLFKAKHEKFKDYISSPKKNWYQSIHTTLYDNNSNIVEIQIQTYDMDKLNKSWIAAHFIYKWFWIDYSNMPEWMKDILNIQKKSINTKWFIEKLKDELISSEIKCLNYDWKVISLPRNSVLIDFAFKLSKNDWIYFDNAIVNGIAVIDPFWELKDWDYIKIYTSDKVNLNYKVENIILVKTQEARENLKNMFNKFSKTKTQDLWKFLLNNDLEIYSYKHFEHLPNKVKNEVFKNFWVKNEKQLFLFLWLWITDHKKVSSYISTFLDKKDFVKEISLKIFTKTNDFTTIEDITNIFYNLNININNLNYKKTWNTISVSWDIKNKEDLDNLLEELKRAPNVLKVLRIFSMRLKLYYMFFLISIFILLSLVITINLIDLSSTKRFLVKWIFYWSIIFMVFVTNFLKYIVKRLFPDVLRYKRFWLSIFLLNTLIVLIVFWELYYLWLYFDFFLYLIFTTFMYLSLLFQYLNFRKSIVKFYK